MGVIQRPLCRRLGLLLVLLLPLPLHADVAVLVHGYHSSASAWERSGVVSILEDNGWARAGLYTATARGVQLFPAPESKSSKRTYLVDLPSEAPGRVQSALRVTA